MVDQAKWGLVFKFKHTALCLSICNADRAKLVWFVKTDRCCSVGYLGVTPLALQHGCVRYWARRAVPGSRRRGPVCGMKRWGLLEDDHVRLVGICIAALAECAGTCRPTAFTCYHRVLVSEQMIDKFKTILKPFNVSQQRFLEMFRLILLCNICNSAKVSFDIK